MWPEKRTDRGRKVWEGLRGWLAWGWLLGGIGVALWLTFEPQPGMRADSRPTSHAAKREPPGETLTVRQNLGSGAVPPAAKQESVCNSKAASIPMKVLRTRPIQEIRVGQRVMGTNPLRSQVEPGKEGPDPVTWRQLDLRLMKPGGRCLEAVLLRPEAWLERNGVRVGGTVELDLPEMGAKGRAEVLAVGSCPPIEPGRGNVVTGTFKHEPQDNILNVTIEGLATPLGVTDTHPFWSEDRQEFIPVGKLRVGERVRTRATGVARVTEIIRRPREDWVYTLEVYGEHVYEVSELGVVVHNASNLPGDSTGPLPTPRPGPAGSAPSIPPGPATGSPAGLRQLQAQQARLEAELAAMRAQSAASDAVDLGLDAGIQVWEKQLRGVRAQIQQILKGQGN